MTQEIKVAAEYRDYHTRSGLETFASTMSAYLRAEDGTVQITLNSRGAPAYLTPDDAEFLGRFLINAAKRLAAKGECSE